VFKASASPISSGEGRIGGKHGGFLRPFIDAEALEAFELRIAGLVSVAHASFRSLRNGRAHAIFAHRAGIAGVIRLARPSALADLKALPFQTGETVVAGVVSVALASRRPFG